MKWSSALVGGVGRLIGGDVLLLGMIVLGIVTFTALAGFITLCDRI